MLSLPNRVLRRSAPTCEHGCTSPRSFTHGNAHMFHLMLLREGLVHTRGFQNPLKAATGAKRAGEVFSRGG